MPMALGAAAPKPEVSGVRRAIHFAVAATGERVQEELRLDLLKVVSGPELKGMAYQILKPSLRLACNTTLA